MGITERFEIVGIRQEKETKSKYYLKFYLYFKYENVALTYASSRVLSKPYYFLGAENQYFMHIFLYACPLLNTAYIRPPHVRTRLAHHSQCKSCVRASRLRTRWAVKLTEVRARAGCGDGRALSEARPLRDAQRALACVGRGPGHSLNECPRRNLARPWPAPALPFPLASASYSCGSLPASARSLATFAAAFAASVPASARLVRGATLTKLLDQTPPPRSRCASPTAGSGAGRR